MLNLLIYLIVLFLFVYLYFWIHQHMNSSEKDTFSWNHAISNLRMPPLHSATKVLTELFPAQGAPIARRGHPRTFCTEKKSSGRERARPTVPAPPCPPRRVRPPWRRALAWRGRPALAAADIPRRRCVTGPLTETPPSGKPTPGNRRPPTLDPKEGPFKFSALNRAPFFYSSLVCFT